jgi:hypothetical protein
MKAKEGVRAARVDLVMIGLLVVILGVAYARFKTLQDGKGEPVMLSRDIQMYS